MSDARIRKPRRLTLLLAAGVSLMVLAGGCAKYNTYFNAKRSFDDAERVRDEAIKQHQDPPVPNGTQRTDYENAIKKAQKLIDEYPGHSLTDDALFLQAKSYYRLQSYRMSIRKFDLLFQNFPATPYLEEAYYLQSLNYLLLGSAAQSQDFLDRLGKQFPNSKYRSQTLKVSGDNAYALEHWEEAEQFYADYLAQYPQTEEWDRVGLKLGACRWELHEYRAAADILQETVEKTSSQESAFRADLLRAKCLVRTGDLDLAEQVLSKLEEKAPIYSSQGEVLLVQVELLVAQGRDDEAFPVLEAMPDEWKTPQVKARSADLRAHLRLERNELEEAQAAFKDALLGRTFLDDEFATRRLSDNVNEYLAAENQLPDAAPDKVARLKLLQANALLFGFDRPEAALELYRAAAVDTAADSTVAARALYGVVKVYREYLDQPDSALAWAQSLQERYPDSPQAYELSAAGGGNLLAFLLEKRTVEQAERFAALSEQEKAELEELGGREAGRGGPDPQRDRLRLRRRMVYLSRRGNIEFPPSEIAVRLARRAQGMPPEGGPGGDPNAGPAEGRDPLAPGGPGARAAALSNDPNLPGTSASQEQQQYEPDLPPDDPEARDAQTPPPAKEDEEKKEEQPKSRRNWEFGDGEPAPRPSAEGTP